MFKREKKQKSVVVIQLLSRSGSEIFCCPLEEFPFSEDTILQYSQEFFSDPEPCPIHRRAVALRLMAEITETVPCGGNVKLSSLPAHLAEIIGHEADTVCIMQKGMQI